MVCNISCSVVFELLLKWVIWTDTRDQTQKGIIAVYLLSSDFVASDAVSPVVVPEKPKKGGSIIEFFGFKKKTNPPSPIVSPASPKNQKKSPVLRTPEQEEEMEKRKNEWLEREREAIEK